MKEWKEILKDEISAELTEQINIFETQIELKKLGKIDDKIFGGPLMQQYRSALQWLKSKLDVRYIIEGSGPRKEVWEIPETALKEAVVNALSHRDYYDKGGRIMIELFDDRLEISNPGGLVSAISPNEFGKKSSSRNPLIFGLFERINMVEQVGSGIHRISESIKEAGLPEPEFNTEGMFTVVFKRKTTQKTTQKTTRKTTQKTTQEIIEAIKQNPEITRKELAELINDITEDGIKYHLNKLKKEGKLKRVGPDKGGYWEIVEK
jgi:ATP-dependent DNA helicase RecG